MKIKLVAPPYVQQETYYVTPPLGLLQIAGQLLPLRHEIEIVDFVLQLRSGKIKADSRLYDTCARMIMEGRPDVVGFTTVSLTYTSVLNIARRCKELDKNVFIMLGGPQATATHRETLERFDFIDLVVRGEGETTVVETAGKIQQGTRDFSSVEGVSYRHNGGILVNSSRALIQDLDALEMPAFGLAPAIQEYRAGSVGGRFTALLDSGRGCSFNCIFCSSELQWKRRVRYKSVERILREIRLLIEKYSVDEIYFIHDLFTSNKKLVKDLCTRMIEESVKVDWQCRCRVDTIDDAVMGLMKKAGCTRILFGIESGSEDTIKFIGKKTTPEKVIHAQELSRKYGYKPSNFFIFGFPEDTFEDLEKTLDLIIKTYLISTTPPTTMILSPLPKTQLYDRYRDDLIAKDFSYFDDGIRFNDGAFMDEDVRLISQYPDIFSSFYNIKTRNIPLDLIFSLKKDFVLLLQYYVFSFILLSRELSLRYVDLFQRWAGEECSDAIDGFYGFAKKMTEGKKLSRWYLADMLEYEHFLAKSNTAERSNGRPGNSCVSFDEVDFSDAAGLSDRAIEVPKNVELRRFNVNIPEVIKGLRSSVDVNVAPVDTALLFVPSAVGYKMFSMSPSLRDFFAAMTRSKTLRDFYESIPRAETASSASSMDVFRTVCRTFYEKGALQFKKTNGHDSARQNTELSRRVDQ